jgi:hypothetical protein
MYAIMLVPGRSCTAGIRSPDFFREFREISAGIALPPAGSELIVLSLTVFYLTTFQLTAVQLTAS